MGWHGRISSTNKAALSAILRAPQLARELTTWISEEGPDADLDIARRAAPFFALKGDQAETIIVEVSAALKGWQTNARKLGMSSADIAVYTTAIQTDG
jgi:serine/threonine-protein kinase HipA